MLSRSFASLGRRLCFCYRWVGFEPLHEKMSTGGEDAYLCTENVQAVLDGVSWWRDKLQVDAGLYSAALARGMYDNIHEDLFNNVPASSLQLLDKVYIGCNKGEIQGTCTALVATLQAYHKDAHNDGYKFIEPPALPSLADGAYFAEEKLRDLENRFLDVISLGDCTLLVVRRGQLFFLTEEQQHDLDFPFQIGTGSHDRPTDGYKYLIPVLPGDIVIMGSDGIFDNLFPNQVVEMVWGSLTKIYAEYNFPTQAMDGIFHANQENHSSDRRIKLVDNMMTTLDEIGSNIVHEALAVSKDIRCRSPYADKCIEHGALYQGGKPDDMTLLISIIGLEESEMSGERFSNSQIVYPQPYRDWP